MIVQRANRYQREWQHPNHVHLCYSDNNNTYVGVRTTGGATRSRYWPYRLAGTCRLQTFSLGYWFSRKSCATNRAMCQRRAGASGERKHPPHCCTHPPHGVGKQQRAVSDRKYQRHDKPGAPTPPRSCPRLCVKVLPADVLRLGSRRDLLCDSVSACRCHSPFNTEVT